MIAILQFLGTNCEQDIAYAYKILQKDYTIVWQNEKELPRETSLVVIPGGFSYGDYLRSGAIAKFAPIMQSVIKYANNGGFVLGICNGFQILTEAKLLPGVLMRNKDLRFQSKMLELEVIANDNKLLQSYTSYQKIKIPIANADGNYYADRETLETLKENHQILFRYIDDINGSQEHIAGICNANKNIFGMMPHPERAIQDLLGSSDGLAMLKDICE